MNQDNNLIGKRIRLIRKEDSTISVKSGDTGIITEVDYLWDEGRTK